MKFQKEIHVIPASAGMTYMWDSIGAEPFAQSKQFNLDAVKGSDPFNTFTCDLFYINRFFM
jgi:hypothetical protein